MTGKCGMPSRALLVLGMAVVFGSTTASAQSLKGMFNYIHVDWNSGET